MCRAVSLEVSPVSSRRDRREFIELPFRLHANDPRWIPPLKLERRLFLSPRFNAYFKHADVELFLARRDGRVVGRISAQIDHAYNDYHQSDWGWFGFLELEEDPEADAGAARRRGELAARARLRANGRAGRLRHERRGRSAVRGIRPRADGQAAVAPALLPAAVRGGRPREGDRPLDVGALHRGPGQGAAGGVGARREARAGARHPDPPDDAPHPAARPRGLPRDLQRRLEAQLGLRPLLGGGHRRLRPGAAPGLRPGVVHDRRNRPAASRSAPRSPCPTSTWSSSG